MKRVALAVALLLISMAGYGAWFVWGPGDAPQGQEAIVDINPQTVDQLRAAFNGAAEHPRMIALLSPT